MSAIRRQKSPVVRPNSVPPSFVAHSLIFGVRRYIRNNVRPKIVSQNTRRGCSPSNSPWPFSLRDQNLSIQRDVKNLLSCFRNLASAWNASNGDFTSAVTKPTPPDTLAGSGGRATKSAAIKPEEKSEEKKFAPRAPPKYPRRKSRHGDARPRFPLVKSPNKTRPYPLDNHSEKFAILWTSYWMQKQVIPRDGDFNHARLALKEKSKLHQENPKKTQKTRKNFKSPN
ncbi:hypothetical protein AVEN_86076-1 [Araneus ventricosus]|uniref:Uncharacterized protein n=1 Tax=Araneus ventricosus TaxID=182803 RepID=A0A4Y2IN39_ARAVE|nr:hypothetical protein AVEN_86076-1 [Araneus ventricosus]